MTLMLGTRTTETEFSVSLRPLHLVFIRSQA